MMKNIQNLNLSVNFIKEGKSTIAYSPALDISTAGKTEAEAKKRFEEMVKIFFQDLIQRGVLEEVLTELGWKKTAAASRAGWKPPRVNYKSVSVNVPVFA
jgi:predicted RNase H-like HicB family nuclease